VEVLLDVCTPPWPLQAPRPVAVLVVPSLQVAGVLPSAACATPIVSAIKGAARSPAQFRFFMKLNSLV
jgi:hypothetical protein